MCEYYEDPGAYSDMFTEEAGADPCFRVRGGTICRNPRTGIECFFPIHGRALCHKIKTRMR